MYGYETRLLVLTRESNFSIIDEFMSDFSPKLICFTAVTSEYVFIKKIGKYINQRYPDRFLLIGGSHISLSPDESVFDIFDALCIGEGEEATLELVKLLERNIYPTGISNLWIKNGNGIEKNGTRPFINNIDWLPFPDRKMWYEWIDMERSSKRPVILLGRGCPFICTYCCNHALRKLAEGPYVRLRSPENIIREIEELLQQFPMVKEIYFEVETFGVNINWSLELCSRLEDLNARRSQPLTFGVNLRITPRTEELEVLFAALEKSNFRFVNIGLESGSERIRRDILKRYYSNEDIIDAVKLARGHGLEVHFYNIIGLVSETIDEFKETVNMNRTCLPDSYTISIFYPYPGTDLYKFCERKRMLPPRLLSTNQERVKATLDFPEFTKRQIQKAFIWFDYYVYGDLKPIGWLKDQVLSRYFYVYKGDKKYLIPFIITKDFLSPSLKFDKKYQEWKLYVVVILSCLNSGKDKLLRSIKKLILLR